MTAFVKSENGNVTLTSPYDPEFPSKARALGGVWVRVGQFWGFPGEKEAEVRALAIEHFGADDAQSFEAGVNIRPGLRRLPSGVDPEQREVDVFEVVPHDELFDEEWTTRYTANYREVTPERQEEHEAELARAEERKELEARQAEARSRLYACQDETAAADWDPSAATEAFELEATAAGSVHGVLTRASVQGELVRVSTTGSMDSTTWCRGSEAVHAARDAALTAEQSAEGRAWMGSYGDDTIDQAGE